MRVRLLGRPAIDGTHRPVDLRGPRQAGLLALLATEVGQVVRTTRIEDELWDGQIVSESAVRVTINRLRARFLADGGPDPIASHPHGYALDLDPADVDLNRFTTDARAVSELRSKGRAADAVRRADAAEAWWRGPAFDGVADLPTLVAERARLDAVHEDLWQQRAAALIEIGELDEALDQLERLVAAAPYRETAWSLQLYALARSGRRDEAARRYRQLVDLLDTDLRITPAPATVSLAGAIRSGDADPAVGRALLTPPPSPTSTRRATTGGPARSDAAHRASRAAGPFVGRGALLDELLRFALDPGADVGSVAIVEGVPGIGKSRLAAELADRVVDAGGTTLTGICPREGGSGLAPLADIVGQALVTVEPDVTLDLEPLESLVPGSFPDARAPDPDPDIRRLQLFDAALQALSLVVPVPVLVIVDDLHWISVDGARFLHHLMDRSSARWLLLSRTGEHGSAMTELLADVARWRPSWHALDPLGPADVAELVRIVAPDASEAQERVVIERAGGNPVFVTELLRHLMSGADESTVPPGIDQLVRASLGRLDPVAVRVAETLAIAQDPVPSSLLAAACDLPGDEVDGALAALAAAGLTDETATSTGLSHDLIADAVGATVGPTRRLAVHTAVGRALATGDQQLHAAALGHLMQGRTDVEPIELDRLAAVALRHLNEGAAFEEAIRVGNEYLEVATRTGPITRTGLDARVQLAAALLTAGPFGRGMALLDQIRPAIRRSGDAELAADAILARGTANVADPGLATLVHEARLVHDALEPSASTRRSHLACWIGHHLALLGHDADALEMVALAADEDRFDPDPAVAAMVAGVRMQIASGIAATPQEFRAAYADLCGLAERLPTLGSEAWQRLVALDQAIRDGTLDDHATAIHRLADVVERFPRPELAWTVHAARAAQALGRGQLDRAEELVSAAQMAGGELRVGSSAAVWITQMFQLQFERGAVATMTPFLSSLDENASAYQLTARAIFALDAGDLAQAIDMATRLREDDRVLDGTGAGWALLASQVGDLALATADRRLAELVIAELTPHAGTALSTHGLLHLGATDRTLGLAWATLDEVDRAIDLLEQAHTDDTWRGARRWAGRAARAAAELRRRRDRPGDLDAARLLDGEAEILLRPV